MTILWISAQVIIPRSSKQTESDSSTPVIIGSTIGGVTLLCLVAALAMFYVRRLKNVSAVTQEMMILYWSVT
jgi:hypothetical protein